jgi:hypothetical protein
VEVVAGQADLLQIVSAVHPVGGLPDFLDCREEETDQDGDYGDDD